MAEPEETPQESTQFVVTFVADGYVTHATPEQGEDQWPQD